MSETNQINKLPSLLYLYQADLLNLSSELENATLQNPKLSRLRNRIVTDLERTEIMLKKLRKDAEK